MERLTCWSPKFNNPVSNGACKDITCFGECDSCKINDLIAKLCAYEDSGLEPEQVMELKSFTQGGIHKVDDGWKHVQGLLQAEQAGRLVVLEKGERNGQRN